MALEELIARLERECGTSRNVIGTPDVPANPLETLGGTAGTSGTSRKAMAESRFGFVEHREVATRARQRPPTGSLVARILAAGGVSRIGGHRPGGGLYRTAELPGGAPADLVAELRADGWHVIECERAALERLIDSRGGWNGPR